MQFITLTFLWNSYSSISISDFTKKLFQNRFVFFSFLYALFISDFLYNPEKLLTGVDKNYFFEIKKEPLFIQNFINNHWHVLVFRKSFAANILRNQIFIIRSNTRRYIIFCFWYSLKGFWKYHFSFHPDIFKGELNGHFSSLTIGYTYLRLIKAF